MNTDDEFKNKNKIYDHTADPVWRQVVYEPVHGGWEFVNIGGRDILNFIGQMATEHGVFEGVEFCCGSGATCRYLAQNYDLRLTGLDINENQIEFARALLEDAPPDIAEKIKFVNADALNWQPPQKFEFAFIMDSLMLLPDLARCLQNSYSAIEDNGFMVVAEVGAGTQITPEARRTMWEFDGMTNLLTADEYSKALLKAGFKRVRTDNETDLAIQCFQTMSNALERHADQIIKNGGEQSLRDWQQNTNFYLNGFKSDVIRYLRTVGEK